MKTYKVSCVNVRSGHKSIVLEWVLEGENGGKFVEVMALLNDRVLGETRRGMVDRLNFLTGGQLSITSGIGEHGWVLGYGVGGDRLVTYLSGGGGNREGQFILRLRDMFLQRAVEQLAGSDSDRDRVLVLGDDVFSVVKGVDGEVEMYEMYGVLEGVTG